MKIIRIEKHCVGLILLLFLTVWLKAQTHTESVYQRFEIYYQRIDSILQKAGFNNLDTRLKNCRNLTGLLDNYRIYMGKNVMKPIQKQSSPDYAIMLEIENLLVDFFNHPDMHPDYIAEQTSKIEHTIPSSPLTPNIHRISPSFVFPENKIESRMVSIYGKFYPHDMTYGFLKISTQPLKMPVLYVNGKQFISNQIDTSRISFSISKKYFYSLSNDTTYSLLPVEFNMSYTEFALKIFKKHRQADFGSYIAIMPRKAGKLTFSFTQKNEIESKVHKTTKTYFQHSSNHDIIESYCLPPIPSGWTLIPGSVKFVIERSKGIRNNEWTYASHNIDGKICYTVETRYNRLGTSGLLNFHFEYDIKHNQYDYDIHNENAFIGWGDSIVFHKNDGEWHLKFKAFTGEIFHLDSIKKMNPFIENVEIDGNRVVIVAVKPEDFFHE